MACLPLAMFNAAKHVASGKLTILLTKQAEKSLGSNGLVFLIIF